MMLVIEFRYYLNSNVQKLNSMILTFFTINVLNIFGYS
jgi:hypothetical protein